VRRIASVESDDVWSTTWPIVQRKFELCSDGLLRNARLEHERESAAANSAERSQSGKKGAAVRWSQPEDREPFP
jgi:hypothetical protein